MKEIHIQYFAALREQADKTEESIFSSAKTARQLYQELQSKYNFSVPTEDLMLALNDSYQSLDSIIENKDRIVFIPPVAGG